MGSELTDRFNAEVELISSSGGVYEIQVDGKLIFSKKKLQRFPEDGEVENLIESAAG